MIHHYKQMGRGDTPVLYRPLSNYSPHRFSDWLLVLIRQGAHNRSMYFQQSPWQQRQVTVFNRQYQSVQRNRWERFPQKPSFLHHYVDKQIQYVIVDGVMRTGMLHSIHWWLCGHKRWMGVNRRTFPPFFMKQSNRQLHTHLSVRPKITETDILWIFMMGIHFL